VEDKRKIWVTVISPIMITKISGQRGLRQRLVRGQGQRDGLPVWGGITIRANKHIKTFGSMVVQGIVFELLVLGVKCWKEFVK
jgi:hypothetical protein